MIGRPKNSSRPLVHLAGDRLGRPQEDRVAGDGELQVALVVERHRLDLAQGVLAVEHPAVGAREQGVGDVADALLRRVACGLAAGPGALDPLPLEVIRNRLPDEGPRPRIAHLDPGATDERIMVEKGDALVAARTTGAPGDPLIHEVELLRIQRSKSVEGVEHGGPEDVGVLTGKPGPDLEPGREGYVHGVSRGQRNRGMSESAGQESAIVRMSSLPHNFCYTGLPVLPLPLT